jgi:hypothetical protein
MQLIIKLVKSKKKILKNTFYDFWTPKERWTGKLSRMVALAQGAASKLLRALTLAPLAMCDSASEAVQARNNAVVPCFSFRQSFVLSAAMTTAPAANARSRILLFLRVWAE